MKDSKRSLHTTRRQFLRAAGVLGATSSLSFGAPLWSIYRHPGELLHVACIGVGGMGASDLGSVASAPNVRIVALCDVDAGNLGRAATRFPEARTFTDWRRLLDELGDDIDAVTISTPDHMHAPIALAAMSLGKHVYCQKPIAHNLAECRAMTEAAASAKVVTQMGTQIHSLSAYRTAVATLRSGALGKIREVHSWVSKSWAGPAAGRPDRTDEVPTGLSWDLWLGVAPERPYVQGLYHPGSWRGWRDFGCGTLGDMGCHIFDPVFSALGLVAPTKITSLGPQHHAETFAADSDIRYVFPGTEWTTDEVQLRWTDGSAESRPDASRAQLPEGVALPGAGSFLVGEKGVMVIPHWSNPSCYRAGEPLDVPLVELPSLDHYHEWANACRGEGKSSTPFEYSGRVTEAVLAGTVAGAFRGRELSWDSGALRFDHAEAQALVAREYRKGFALTASPAAER